jgi:hypothetical protein
MKTINKSAKRVIYPLLFIILSAIVVVNIIRIADPKQNVVETYKVDGGWGYRIVQGEQTVVVQPFIPLLPGRTPFPNQTSAKKTGKLVMERLEKGQVPVLTFTDLEKLGLIRNQ